MKPERYNGRYNNDSLDRDLDDDDSSMSDDGNDGDLNRESQDDCGINYRPLALKVKRSDPFKTTSCSHHHSTFSYFETKVGLSD